MPGLLRVFSLRSREDIEELERETAVRPEARTAQRALADEVTTLGHGAEEHARVVPATQPLFGQGDLRTLDSPTLGATLADVPSAPPAPTDLPPAPLPPPPSLT